LKRIAIDDPGRGVGHQALVLMSMLEAEYRASAEHGPPLA